MALGGTPLESITVQMKGKEIVIPSSRYEEAINQIVRDVGEGQVQDFVRLFRENIILQLRMLPASTHEGGTRSLREEIISKISEVKFTNTPEGFKASFSIDHELALALEDGTGIYGPTGQPITPKNREYMFIPGIRYIRGFETRKYIRQGLSERQAKSMVRQEINKMRTVARRTERRQIKGESEAKIDRLERKLLKRRR